MCKRQVEDRKSDLLRKEEDDNYQAILAARIREDVHVWKARATEDKDLLHTENTCQDKDPVSSSQFLTNEIPTTKLT